MLGRPALLAALLAAQAIRLPPGAGAGADAPPVPLQEARDVRAEARRVVHARRMRLRLDPLLEELVAERDGAPAAVPGLFVAAISRDEIVYRRALGRADLDGGGPVTGATVFPIGAVGETLAAAAVAGLVEEGTVAWDEPVSLHLSAWPPAGAGGSPAPTFEHLLGHTAGYAAAEILWRGDPPRGELLRAAGRAEPVRPPGEAYEPFRPGPLVVAVAASAAAGEGWGQLLGRRVLRPVGMGSTFLGAQPGRDVPRATAYLRDRETGALTPVAPPAREPLALTAGMRSTGSDLARWARFLLEDGRAGGGRVLAPASMRALMEARVRTAEGGRALLGAVREGERRVIEARDGLEGCTARVVLLPDDGAAWVLLANADADEVLERFGRELTEGLAEERPERWSFAPGEDGTPASRPAGVPPGAGALVSAVFLGGAGEALPGPLRVVLGGQGLALVPAGRPPIPLGPPLPDGRLPLLEARDGPDAVPRFVAFENDADGGITALVVHVAGFEFRYPRRGTEVPEGERPPVPGDLLGAYRHPVRGVVEVIEHRGGLAVAAPGGLALELDPPDGTGRRALSARPQLGLTFERGPDGTVTGLVQHLPSGDLGFERVGEEDLAAPAEEAPPEESTEPAEEPAAGETPAAIAPSTSIEVVDAFRASEERAAAFARAGGIRMTGAVLVPTAGIAGSTRLELDGVERFRWEIDLEPFGRWALALDGDRATEKPWFGEPRSLPAEEVPAVRRRHPAAFLVDWDPFGSAVSVVGTSPEGTRLAVAGGEAPDLLLTVGADGDVLSAELDASAAPRLRFSDPRELGGVRLPFRWTLETPPLGRATLRWSDLEPGVSFPDGTFDLRPESSGDS